jgi:hypothetical protein
MEAAMCTVIIGVGVVSMLQLLAVGTVTNSEGAELTMAVNLANNVREMTLGMAYYDPQQPTVWNTREATVAQWDNIMDLDGAVFTPPIDARRTSIAGYSGWVQRVEVEAVSKDKVLQGVGDTTTEPTARVTVTVERNGTRVYRTSWLVVAPKAN